MRRVVESNGPLRGMTDLKIPWLRMCQGEQQIAAPIPMQFGRGMNNPD
jgi:hypothetical protein